MAHYKTKEWLIDELHRNGMSLEDLSSQTGIGMEDLKRLSDENEANQHIWDVVLGQLNFYPTIDYPSESILEDLQNDMNQIGPEAKCTVFYGVNADDLIFTDYQLPGEDDHGANVDIYQLSKLHISLEEAYELFEKQNMTL